MNSRLQNYVKLGPDGLIDEVQRNTEGQCPKGYIKITDPVEALLLAGNAKRLRYVDGHLVRKPVVRLKSDKTEIIAGGEDVVKVWVEDLPDGMDSVVVTVNVRNRAVLKRGMAIPITVKKRAPVAVRIAKRQLVVGRELIIRGAVR